jgi:hypothetical protein
MPVVEVVGRCPEALVMVIADRKAVQEVTEFVGLDVRSDVTGQRIHHEVEDVSSRRSAVVVDGEDVLVEVAELDDRGTGRLAKADLELTDDFGMKCAVCKARGCSSVFL